MAKCCDANSYFLFQDLVNSVSERKSKKTKSNEMDRFL